MEASIIGKTNVTNIADCISELVSNSLNANATSIAIRIHSKERKIQVIDNGIGIPKIQLKTIGEYNSENLHRSNIYNICNRRKQTLINIRRLSNAVIVASRYYNSFRTYMKIFKAYHEPEIVRINRRPSQGTTICIYGFHELCLSKWDTSFMYYLIGNIAIANPYTSFTVRDDQEGKVTMAITKPHNPIDIFKLLYNREVLLNKMWYIKSMEKSDVKFCAFIGLTNVKSIATQYIFLNNKLVHCPLILQIIATIFINSLKFTETEQGGKIPRKEEVFILLFVICAGYIFTIENGKKTLIFSNVHDLLQSIRDMLLKICTKDITPLSVKDLRYNRRPAEQFKSNKMVVNTDLSKLITPISQKDNIMNGNIQLTFSEWSTWSYAESLKQLENSSLKFYKHFDFLPENLHKLLRGKTKLVKTNILNYCNGSMCSAKLKSGLQIPDVLPHQDINVRRCKIIQRYREFKLNRELLKTIKVLGQMNNELIVGIASQNNMKILLLMDQHAIHERIRYEELLSKYKIQLKSQLFPAKLKNPIIIKLPADSCNLLLSNQKMVKKFGISFSMMSNDTIMVYAVPECLRKNKYYSNELKLKLNAESLLNELLQRFTTYGCYRLDSLPLTIHNAIAMEACHGTFFSISGCIRFGVPLTLKECKSLLKLLYKTKCPNRCAHGRPSIVPLMELTDLEARHKNTVPVCNTFFHMLC
ncbi:DNA mismatch repair protein MutL [Xylocopa sonorina]|uniref:DNA mismatch repair protein MutL n=1 Tax=Xylocopa sonorina TaxID=1818115 RepID=UPI00403A8A7B